MVTPAITKLKDAETSTPTEVPSNSKHTSEKETEDTLDDILDQLDELDSILDGY